MDDQPLDIDLLPSVRDGLNREERAILYCLKTTQSELNGRNIPTILLYGRVLELIDISQERFQALLSKLSGFTE